MVLKVMYVIELLDADDGGIELVDPAWSPEEGPPRKKIKSPPAISPTGSSTSLYSGGSSIDWTTTGTTLDMQGTRVTRTQYGFRTLQESSAKMCLKVTGYPLPEITWYKDDVLLKEDERRTFYADDDGFFAMTIDPVQATDTGRYTCVATNEYGQASTSAFFKVLKVEKEAAPPAFTNSLRDQECKEGEVVNFECEVEGWPEPELVWLVDEQPLRPSHDFRLQYDGQKASLEIRDAQPDDTGIYAVRITNEFGTKETNAKLVVQPDPDKNHVAPEFQAVTEDVECDEGDTVKFKAVITGDPEPDIVWYVNGHPLTPSEKIKFISEDGICIVTIKDVSRHFDGTITCEGKNRLGTTTCDARLKVRVPPLPPQFDRPLEDRIVTEKSAVMFEVDVSGYPDPKVEFFLKGKKLEDGINGVSIQQRDNYYKVTIQNCSLNEHDGEILARAINEHGQAESRARLVVEPEEEDSRSAPTFLKDIEDQTVKMGEKATFTTCVKGSPNPTVSWYINGTKLEPDEFTKIEANGSDHKLVVDSTKYAGTVLCRAENQIGRFETKARLIVLPLEKKKKSPEFTQPLKDVTELEGNTAVFEVTVDAEPKATLTWKVNGNTVTENDKFKFREFNGSSKLEIHKIDLKDIGTVTCTATNSEGEATCQAKLNVTRHEQKPILKKKPNNATVPIGQKVVFEAQADAVPAAEFTWYIDGKKVWNSTQGTSIETDTQSGTTKLVIDTNILPNPATIVIVAENKLGTDEGMAQLFTTQAAQEDYQKLEHEKLKEHAEFNVHSESAEPSTTISHEKLQEGGRQVISFEAEEEPYRRESVERFEEHAHSNVQGLQEVGGFNQLDNISQQLIMQKELFNQRVQRGHQAQFQTVVENANNVRWWMGDQLLGQTSPGVRFSEGPANEHILIVESAQSSTTIKFEAGSGDNQVQSLARLDVADRPTFTQGGLNPVVKVEEGQPVVLNVKFTEEAKVNWSYNDRPIGEALPGAQVTTQDGESILRIPEAKPDMNNAILGVSAENEFGKASEETRLVVDKKGEPPKITKGPPNKSVHEHEVVLFSAEVSQVQPIPTVEWRVNGELVTPSHPTFALSQVGNQYMLRVNDAAISHSGNVTVTAKNSAGEDSAQSTFEVKKKPKPVPSFKQGIPGELNAKEGEPLKVTVSAPNADQINWSLNGEPLKDGQNGVQITQNGPESSLHIPSVSKDHAGKLGVEAVNESGKENSDGNLKVTPKGSPPKIAEWPQGAKVTEKETVQFSSTIQGEPKPEVQWTVNNKPVATSDGKFVLSEDGNKYTLTIKDTALENAGEIQVQAKNPLGSDKAAAYLEVKPAPKPPIFKQKLNDANVDEGKPATFTVTLENPTPDTKVTWSLNGKPLQNGPDAQISDNGNGTYTLVVPKATPDLAGKIAVKAENPIGANESDANLNVKPALKPPIFKQGLGDQNVDEGKPAQFTAILENPTPDTKITWLLNGSPIQNEPNAQVSDNGNGTYTLNIPSASPDRSGKISIKAENPAGSNDSNANLNVKPALKAPIFKQGLNDANVDEGKPVTFTVTLENPTPDTKLTWFLNGKPVQAGPNAQIADNGNGTYTLTIPNATPDLSGKVSVKAENPAGSNESNANLNVKPALKPPQFKAKLSDKSVNEGQPIRYDVEIENPTPDTKLTWLLNGKPLENGDKCQIVDHGDGTHHLTLSHATPDMTGQLTVKAENPAGSSDSSAKLEVKAAGDKPKFSKVPQDAETEEENSVKFSAYVSGKPSPKVTWYLNGEEVKHSDAIRVKHDPESGKTSIRIFKPVIPQSGVVKVVAENEHGKIEAQANLKVVKKLEIPEFMTDMTDRQINEGESAKFTTKIKGYPEPEISWTLDGKPITATNIKISASGDVHTLEITDAEISQTGEVSCSATNSKGTKKQNAQLIVKEVGRAPLFIRNLEDKMVDERETVVMLAELDPKVKPKPSVSWFKDGQPLESDEHIKVEVKDNQCKLMILQAQLNDKCRITIKADNVFGTAETAASIAVQRKQMQTKPQFLSELQPLTIQEGDSLQTSILISGNPTPIAKWYINDQLVCQTEDTEIKNENGVYSLVIHGCTTDMTGKIKCTAVNRMGEVSTEGTLNVIAPIPVEFETSLCDATCREGDTLKLKAVLVGEPMPDVTWYVNGKKLVESQNIKIHAEKGTYTVTIKDITMDYSGKVLCEAVNEFGKASSEAMLKVLPRGEPPDFLEWLSNVRARAGSKVEHKVVFTGDPKPNLYWYINNKEVKDGVDGITIKTTDNTSILTINSFRPEAHVGEIICKAENDAGEVSCTANMILYTSDMVSESESDAFGEDRLEDFREDTREELTRTPTPVMAPSFITKIKDTTAKKGHQAIFECVVPDTKGVCCKWLKDGKEIELIARIRVQTRTIDGHIANELIIDDVQPEDAGKYTVVVENTAGKDQCEATLTVIDALEKKAPESKAPEFTLKLQDKSVSLKEKVVLECRVTGVPEPTIAWFKDGKPVAQSNEPIKVEGKPDGTQILILDQAQVSSQGEYKCVAKNEAGEAKTEATIKVQALPPQFTKPLSDKEINIGDAIILECSVTGTPQPTVEFYSVVDNVRLQSGTRVAVQHDASNTHWRLVIKETKENDLRKYKAVAKNEAGEVACECVVRAAGPKIEKPKITDGLKNKKIKQGETTEMGVKVAVNPEVQPEVEWFKDGKKIEPEADHVKILANHATGEYVLKVVDARAEDEGQYTVKVSNKAGSDQSEAKMAVEKEEFVAPEFVQPLENVDVAEHETAELKVQVTGKPEPQVTWLKDNTPINIDNQHLIKRDGAQGEHSLTIKDARLEDAGKYSCQAVNKAGQAETTANFGVQEEVEAPKFVEGLKPVEIKEAETAKFDVVVAGKPEPQVQWFKDGHPVQLDGTHLISSQSAGGKHSLTIKDARNEDAGVYTAKAVNKAGSDESKANLGVIEDVEAPEFIKPLEDLEVKPADSVKLEVKVVGKPEPEIAWTKDGVPINIDDKHVISKKEADGSHSLIINEATIEDAGTYSCEASNKAGRKQSVGQLKFGKEGEAQGQGEDVAPMFIEPLKPQNLEEGKPAELICKVNPESKPEIKWFKDGQQIQASPNLVMEKSEDGTIKLKILNASSKDVGEYRCEAVNKAGQDKTIGALKYAQISTVEGGEEEGGFLGFEKELQDQTVEKAKETVLECKLDEISAQTPDLSVEWAKDGAPIKKGTPVRDADGTLTLKLENTEVDDSGKYQCTIKTKDSEAFTSANLTVTDGGAVDGQGKGAPEFVELLKSCTVPEEQQAVLTCKVKGSPRPTIKWYKNGAEIKESDVLKLEYAEDGRITLTIPKAKIDDSAEYRCLAENDHGTAWTEGPIVVTSKDAAKIDGEAPDFVQPIKPVNVEVGKDAVFVGKVSGKPFPEIKWYQGKKEITAADAKFKIESESDGTQRLIVKNCKLEDAGEFRCAASNQYGDVWADTTLTVTTPKAKAPEFEKELEAVDAKQGEDAVFECKLADDDNSKVDWYKGNEKLVPSANVIIEALPNGVHRLILKNVSPDDQGSYRVEAVNPSGSASSKAPLNVQPASEFKLKKGLQDQSLKRGQKLHLSVEVEGKPTTVKWYKDEREISGSSEYIFEKVTDEVYTLTVENSDLSNTGSYKVFLTNGVQSVESSCKVTVSEATQAPTFKKPLTDTSVPKGSPIRLEVEVDGNPTSVKWFKDGEPVPDNLAQDLGNGKYALNIPEAKAEDFGRYSVQVANESGQASSACNVTEDKGKEKGDGDDGGKKPKIVEGLIPQTVKVGEPARFQVKVEGPVKQVKWYKNGKELGPEKAKEVAPGVYALEIPEAEVEDSGDFKVVVSNDFGEVDSNAALTVKLPPIKIVKGLEDLEVPKGTEAVLYVETDRPPKAIKWYKNGKEVSPNEKPQASTVKPNGFQLVIPDADDEDAGTFKAVVYNDDDEPTETFCALTVKLPPKTKEKPKIVDGLADKLVPVGKELEATIKTSGSPTQIKWYKNGSELSPSANLLIQKVDDNTFTLRIPKASLDSTGNYEVVVSNDLGSDESKGKFTVEEPITFLKPLKDQEVIEGERVEFTVETNTKPHTIKWYRNGKEITPDNRIELTEDGNVISCVLKWAQSSDQGQFKVVLTNSAGPAESEAKLTVNKKLTLPPKIIKDLENAIVAKGDAIIFEVVVDGDVADVKWLKDGKNVTNENGFKPEKVDDKTYRLTIPVSELDHAGEYEVQLSNDGGKATSTAAAEVDEIPKIVKGLVPGSVDEGDEHLFRVEVSAPVREVKWYKNGQELIDSPEGKLKKISPKKYELLIPKTLVADAGDYKVVLSNKAGSCDSEAPLAVKKLQTVKLIKPLQDVTLDEGQELVLSCQIEGVPKSVKWYKNGQEVTPSEKLLLSANDNGEYTLKVPAALPGDGAAYRVVFETDKGDVQTGCVAHVRPKKEEEKKSQPTFVSPLQDVTIPEGEILTLKCQVNGQPTPTVKWYRNGQELIPSDRIVQRLALDGTATLRIMDAKKEEAGDFKVIATNEVGTAESTCVVKVLSGDELPSAPKFIIPLKDTKTPIGGTAVFNVKVKGCPKPEVTFTLNGSPVPVDGNRIILEDLADGNWSLTINDITDADFGTLKCTATNENGKADCSAVFGLDDSQKGAKEEEGYPPKFNVPLWDRRVIDRQPTSIECHVDAKPRAEITWFKDGKELTSGNGVEIENTFDGACRVKFAEFKEENCGQYKCVAKNEYGVADTIAHLSIETEGTEEVGEEEETAPRFNPGLTDKKIVSGDNLELTCKVQGVPKPSIVWYKDGIPLAASDIISIDYDEDTGDCSLKIKGATDQHQGAYRCVASNKNGTTNTACLVTVQSTKEEKKKEGAEPFFTKGLVDQWLDRGETVTLHCEVTGDPAPEIKWYRNGTLLKPSDKISIENTPDGKCTCTVKDCNMTDEGVYRCEAENAHGKAKTQCNAHVDMELSKAEPLKVEEGQPPRFIIPLEDVTTLKSSNVALECKVTGVPMPSCKWTKDGVPLFDDHHFEWDNNPAAGTYRLLIKDFNSHYEGTYRCVATNESGSATTKSFVKLDDSVGDRKDVRPPHISAKLSDVRVNEGQPLNLECRIDSDVPPEVTWYKDGAKVVPSDRVRLELTPEGYARLIIPSATLDDDGMYRIVATNEAGTAHDKCTATVKKSSRPADTTPGLDDGYETGKAPKVVIPLETIRVNEKQGFTLRCKFSGAPKLAIKWFKDGERLYSYSHAQITENEDGSTELVVPESSKSDAGTYRCVAENDFGSARTTGQVTVTAKSRQPRSISEQLNKGKAPGFTIPLTIKKAKLGDTVTFECLPYGEPFPGIKWMKDGMELLPKDGIKIEAAEDGTQRLILENVDMLSEGYYRCVATNEHGTASTKAELVLIGEYLYSI
uniref:Muscle M-line assembly protein unc-89 n=1 Tax=Bursaphelenchus xylophilus TaxID=6326 RepID=A0A1I7S955_BURXY